MSSSSFRHRLALEVLAKKNQLKQAGAQGFTLIELLVVIVILGVLGAVGYQAYLNQVVRAYASQAQNTSTAIAKNCAALQVTGEEGQHPTLSAASFDATAVSLTGGPCPPTGGATTFTVKVGTATVTRSATASVSAQGVVTPASLPAA